MKLIIFTLAIFGSILMTAHRVIEVAQEPLKDRIAFNAETMQVYVEPMADFDYSKLQEYHDCQIIYVDSLEEAAGSFPEILQAIQK